MRECARATPACMPPATASCERAVPMPWWSWRRSKARTSPFTSIARCAVRNMADLRVDFAGIRSPNPFWLASAPPTNSGYQVMRAFAAGWGGAVWKTLGDPIVNVSSRFAGLDAGERKLIGLNNIELITDRPLDVNLAEIVECKRAYPDRAIVGSLMMEMNRERWHELVERVQAAGVDGFELNFGCPHGMSERGMGSAVGQVPEYTCMVTEWVMAVAKKPVIVKLTPNVTDITQPARSAVQGGATALSLI